MATYTVIQTPTSPNAAYTRLPYVVEASDFTLEPQFEYVMDVYISGSSNRLSRQTQEPNPAGNAVFDPSRIFQGNLSNDNNWDVPFYDTGSSSGSQAINTVKDFTLEFGKQYSTSTTGSVVVYPNLAREQITVFQGIVEPNGTSFNWSSSSLQTNSILSNCPQAQLTSPYNRIGPDTSLYIAQQDYHTITVLDSPSSYMRVVLKNFESGTIYTQDIGGLPTGQFTTYGIGPQNLIEYGGALAAAVTGSNWDNIEIGIDAGSSGNTFLPKYNLTKKSQALQGRTPVIAPCTNEYTRFAFINNYGFWDYYSVWAPLRKESKVKRENVVLPRVDYSSATSPYKITQRGMKQYYNSRDDEYTIDTDYLTRTTATWLEELIESPAVHVWQEDKGWVPIIITNSSYRANTNTARQKLYNYTIDFRPANKNTQIGITTSIDLD